MAMHCTRSWVTRATRGRGRAKAKAKEKLKAKAKLYDVVLFHEIGCDYDCAAWRGWRLPTSCLHLVPGPCQCLGLRGATVFQRNASCIWQPLRCIGRECRSQ